MSLFGFLKGSPAAVDVLVVEDNAEIRGMVCEVLAGAGLKVAEAVDGRAGYTSAREKRPRLILMDWEMPGYSGIDALQGLKADPATKDIPVLMVTAQQTPAHIDKAVRFGAAGYLNKPVDMRRLLKRVAEFVPVPNPPPGA